MLLLRCPFISLVLYISFSLDILLIQGFHYIEMHDIDFKLLYSFDHDPHRWKKKCLLKTGLWHNSCCYKWTMLDAIKSLEKKRSSSGNFSLNGITVAINYYSGITYLICLDITYCLVFGWLNCIYFYVVIYFVCFFKDRLFGNWLFLTL